ncbi:MAG TPA: hypothetical protein VFZ57_06960 [Thermoanaerobaculia bacterium]|nr:hypothetical protein [Thermoanaerobaculia bacterium]
MKARLALLVAAVSLAAVPALAQRGEERGTNPPRANQGHVPPAPSARTNQRAAPETERHDATRSNSTPHVNNDRWYGHESPDDPRLHLDHPFAHGRFEYAGASYRYSVTRIDRGLHRVWLAGGSFFDVAVWDWPMCVDWCWDCGNDFVVYEDTDHVGWYLLYNIHTGVYVHATYTGA